MPGEDDFRRVRVALTCGSSSTEETLEGVDRPDTNIDVALPKDIVFADDSSAKPDHTIVFLSAPGAVSMPYAGDVSAILLSFFPGEQVGNSVLDLIMGDHAPSGKLPLSLPKHHDQVKKMFTPNQYPGVVEAREGGPTLNQMDYSENLEVGYRYWQKHGEKMAFAFGHGLGYGSGLEIGGLEVATGSSCAVQFSLTNPSASAFPHPQSEVVQVYVKRPGRDFKELHAWSRVDPLKVGETRNLRISLAGIWPPTEWSEEGWIPSGGVGGGSELFVGFSLDAAKKVEVGKGCGEVGNGAVVAGDQWNQLERRMNAEAVEH